MSEALIRAEDVHKTYVLGARSVRVLRGVSISVNAGDFQALRGASGAGKSTLLHLLGGLDSPDKGEIYFKNQCLGKLSATDLSNWRNKNIGLIFQAYHLLPELDALENVCLPARMRRTPVRAAKARAKELLARVGLAERMEHRPYELSGGEQQRVSIARALINEPALILADEPTGNLDSRTGEEIMDLLTALRVERQTTLIIATHDARVAARAGVVVDLLDGQLSSLPPVQNPVT